MLRAIRCLNMVIISVKYFVKSDFKQQSYWPDTILLQGHAVTSTCKVVTQMLRVTRRRRNMVIISVKYFVKSDFKTTKLWAVHDFAARSR